MQLRIGHDEDVAGLGVFVNQDAAPVAILGLDLLENSFSLQHRGEHVAGIGVGTIRRSPRDGGKVPRRSPLAKDRAARPAAARNASAKKRTAADFRSAAARLLRSNPAGESHRLRERAGCKNSRPRQKAGRSPRTLRRGAGSTIHQPGDSSRAQTTPEHSAD